MSAMSRRSLIASILVKRLSPAAWEWAQESARLLQNDFAERTLFMRFSLALRHSSKQTLDLHSEELNAANECLAGWQPKHWRTDHALRIFLLLHIPEMESAAFVSLMDKLFQAADLGEAEALYLSLALLPHGTALQNRAAEGLRSNVKSYFEAVAHYNPFPAQYFDQGTWNQMVLKSLFIESTLNPIYDLDKRSNHQLTRMLCDYAHERWAASRAIAIELWRCVGACPDDGAFEDLERVLTHGSEREQLAAALSLKDNPDDKAKSLLADFPAIHKQVTQGVCWADLLANP